MHVRKKTLVFNCEYYFHFPRFCLFIFLNDFFLVRHRRNLAMYRATFRPYSAEVTVTCNGNTLRVFQYKTNNNKDGRSYICELQSFPSVRLMVLLIS